MGVRPWVACSSSSGQLFREVFLASSPETRKSCLAFFSDRDCAAVQAARDLAIPETQVFGRKIEFERSFLHWLKKRRDDGVVFLCGFFGILSEDFFSQCPWPVFNTHPSLLPAFPGLDQKVHQEAFENALVSGASFHMVNEKLDGGPIVAQASVDSSALTSWEELREVVRRLESQMLPTELERVLRSNLEAKHRHLSTRDLQSVLRNKV